MIFKKYHKIRQFRDIVRDVIHKTNFSGLDEDGEPIYIEKVKPIVTFVGTCKIHGTNAGVSYTPKEGVQALKRSSLLSNENLAGHFGFNQFVQVTNKDYLSDMMLDLWEDHCSGDDQLNLYGEWAGKGIQKGVAVAEIDKSFFVFGLKITNPMFDINKWIDITTTRFEPENMYNIHEFPTFEMDIDFNSPKQSQNKLIELTEQVEKECPVGKQLGVTGIGEGIVWTGFYGEDKLIFKVKGEKHSTSKVKKLASVDPELLESIDKFVNYAVTKNRLDQGFKEVDGQVIQDIPKFLRWMANDIIEEESDVMIANKLEWKTVARECSTKARNYYIAKMNEL